MKKTFRPKIWLTIFLMLVSGAITPALAETGDSIIKILQSSPSAATFDTPEQVNQFLSSHYTELSQEDRELLETALRARRINDGLGDFRSLPSARQAEIIGQAAKGFINSLWPTYDEKTQTDRPGVLGYVANWTDAVMNAPQPVTAQEMVASLNPSRSAFAQQGIAFSQLGEGTSILGGFHAVITDYWGYCRNMAYAILIIVLIVFGFMIMLRQNIEPRIVMTISNALPRIAATLVLITFSFAVSGLIIDIGRVADGIIKGSFGDTQKPNHDVFSLLKILFQNGFGNIGASLESPEYVWKFDEEDLDKNHPTWRCDYDPGCPRGPADCTDANGKPCEKFYCSILPFGGWKNYQCKLWFVPRSYTIAGKDYGPYGVDLISSNQVPTGCYPPDAPCGIYPPPSDNPGCRDAGGWLNNTPCCNRGGGIWPKKCHGDDAPWVAPFPRETINMWEMFINKAIIIAIGILINLLFFLTIFQTVFALLFKMLSCFALWFVYAIFSPLVFMWGAVPGQEDTISSWAKNFLATVLAFPAVNFMINLALAIALRYKGVAGQVPPAPGGGFPSILFIGPKGAVGMLVAYGILLMTPSIPEVIADIVGAKGFGKGAGLPDMSKQVKRIPIIGKIVG